MMRILRDPRLLLSPPYFLITLCAAFYLIAILFARRLSWRDPGSVFFDPDTAYKPIYSDLRRQQAEDFIAKLVESVDEYESGEAPAPPMVVKSGGAEVARMCVGVPSVARSDSQSLRNAVGSLVEGLTARERSEIYLVPFIAQTNPAVHPATRESWLGMLADEVLMYNVTGTSALSAKEIDHLVEIEKDSEGWREKELFDYKFVLRTCLARTKAPYIAIVEDDALAMDGWYHRTTSALEQAEIKTAAQRDSPKDFLYLRLFYTEEFLGWNSEDWRSHTAWSLVTIALLMIALLGIRQGLPVDAKSYLTTRVIFVICVVASPFFIGLFFATGQVTTRPLPTGVNLMSNYGCCSQGMVFPREKVPQLLSWYDTRTLGFVDSLMEELADQHGELRWALTPPVVQHVGGKSSKEKLNEETLYHMTNAQRLWNFAFELNDPESLRREHSIVTGVRTQQQRRHGVAG